MIKIEIKTDGVAVLDSYEEEKPTLQECALIVFRMEEIKKRLLEKKFKSNFEVKEGSFADES